MLINRLIWLLFIIGSGVFASFFGGNISYALFYLSLFIPTISLLYTVYVYFRFKLYQSVESRVLVKGEQTVYSFIIANEDIITFRNIKVNFLSQKSTIEATNQKTEYCLLPNESDKLETKLRCNYRGEYYIGVDTIEIMDYLYLFTITYPVRSKLKAIVFPRVVPIEHLMIAPSQADVKNPIRHSNNADGELDSEMRRYNSGDNKKHIHWKASAKQHELLTRKYLHKPKAEIILFMDLSRIKDDELKVMITEDKIIESILAITNYYSKRGIASQIIYDMGGEKHYTIRRKEDFTAFYQACVSLRFEAVLPLSELLGESVIQEGEEFFFVAATHFLTKDFYKSSLKVLAQGNELAILFISDDITENTIQLINSLRLSGAQVYQVMSEDEIGDILSSKIVTKEGEKI